MATTFDDRPIEWGSIGDAIPEIARTDGTSTAEANETATLEFREAHFE
ncbi:hypothetical protein [Natrinema marinum]|nr:hypothetical protein [Natrinema marinum]